MDRIRHEDGVRGAGRSKERKKAQVSSYLKNPHLDGQKWCYGRWKASSAWTTGQRWMLFAMHPLIEKSREEKSENQWIPQRKCGWGGPDLKLDPIKFHRTKIAEICIWVGWMVGWAGLP